MSDESLRVLPRNVPPAASCSLARIGRERHHGPAEGSAIGSGRAARPARCPDGGAPLSPRRHWRRKQQTIN